MGNDIARENRGIIPDMGRYMINVANVVQGSEDWRRVKSRQKKLQKPKVWESFERLRKWQYQEANNAQAESERLMSRIAGAANVLEKGEWWGVVKNVWRNGEEHSEDGSSNGRKSSSGGSRSR